MSHTQSEWKEELRVAGDQVADRIRQLIREGNARRIIIRKPSGELIREISLTRGIAAGGLLTLIAPALAAVGAVVALLSEVRIEVVRGGTPNGDPDSPERPDSNATERPSD